MRFNTVDRYHLYNRAVFFAHHSEIDHKNDQSKVIGDIIAHQKNTPLTIELPKWNIALLKNKTEKQRREVRKTWRKQVQELNYLWLKQMMDKDKGFIEKMTLFWHGHFACDTSKSPYLTLEMNNLLRKNALGNFKDLLFAVSKSTAMINYLHLKQNKKGKPNEDFARELCELFTLGRDIDYTEKDVSEIARAFTGWRFDAEGNHVVVDRLHDNGMKTIFGETRNFSGEDVLNLLIENKNTARFIAAKLYSFFVKEELNEKHVNELATVFYDSNYSIKTVMTHLFNTEWFYASKGQLIKSPIDLLVGLGKLFDLKYSNKKTVKRIQHYLGQVLFTPPNVAGWAGGRQWIDASRLAFRLRLASLIINRGYIAEELPPELDAKIAEKQNRKDLRFFEEIDWDLFWKKNKDVPIFEVLIRNENEDLKKMNSLADVKTVIHLLSTPDFQLI